jgi:hypothetical protein
VQGTDCTDCGGVDAIVDYNQPLSPDSSAETCTNTCMYPRDGICDDPRGSKYCELGKPVTRYGVTAWLYRKYRV